MVNCPATRLDWEIEEAWRERVLAAKDRYQKAAEQLRETKNRSEADREEADARGEYLRVLEIFSGYVLHGKAPAEAPESK
jgi:hypothetical protein